MIGQRGIQELKSYLNDNDLKLNSVQKNLEKRLSDITGLSLNELGSKRLESTMTVSQLKEVRSSLDPMLRNYSIEVGNLRPYPSA